MFPRHLFALSLFVITIGSIDAEPARRRVAPPRESAFERVLIPLMGTVADGAHVWYTEFWAQNDGPDALTIVHDVTCVEPRPPRYDLSES